MFNECQIDLRHVECRTLEEAKEIGRSYGSINYHILVKNLKVVVVMHPLWQECAFCKMEVTEGAPIVIGHNEFI
jgi:hypothetical protein